MKSQHLVYVFLMLQILVNPINLKAQFQIEGEIRPRFEYRNGYRSLPDSVTSAAYLVTQRSRLGVKYQKDRMTFKFTIQDARVWGEEPLKTDVPSLGIYESWGEFRLFDSLSVRAGRQEVKVDNERFLGVANWSLKGITHDAAVFKYKKNCWKADMGFAFNQSTDAKNFGTDYNSSAYKNYIGTYKLLNYLWLMKNIGKLKLSIIGIDDGYQKRSTTNTLYVRGTMGTAIEYDLKPFIFNIRGFYQTGKDTIGTDISAFFFNAETSFKMSKLTAKLGYDYISGNDGKDTNNRMLNAFSTLYGNAHAYNGHMDFIKDVPKQSKLAGLTDIYLSINSKITGKFGLRCDVHFLNLQNNLLKDKSDLTVWDKYLGTEIDLLCNWDYSREFCFQAGYSTIFATPTLAYLVGGDDGRYNGWAWVMLTFKPGFLFTSK